MASNLIFFCLDKNCKQRIFNIINEEERQRHENHNIRHHADFKKDIIQSPQYQFIQSTSKQAIRQQADNMIKSFSKYINEWADRLLVQDKTESFRNAIAYLIQENFEQLEKNPELEQLINIKKGDQKSIEQIMIEIQMIYEEIQTKLAKVEKFIQEIEQNALETQEGRFKEEQNIEFLMREYPTKEIKLDYQQEIFFFYLSKSNIHMSALLEDLKTQTNITNLYIDLSYCLRFLFYQLVVVCTFEI